MMQPAARSYRQSVSRLTSAAFLLHSHIASRSVSTVDLSNLSAADLKSYTVTPPVKPWPERLYRKRLISMITSQHNLDLALQIFEYAGKYQPGFSHSYDTYLAMVQRLSRARAFESMESLLSQLHESGIKCGENIFIVAIRNYNLAGKPKLALRTFLRIESFNVQRSVRSLNALLNGLIQNRRFDLVPVIFKNAKSKFGVITNIFTCNILIKAHLKNYDLEGALKVFDEMPAMGMVPNVVTYTTIMSGYASRGDIDGAMRIFREILDRDWIPDATTYTILMYGYCKLGRLTDAIKVMDEMEENEVNPNEVTYGVMIEAFCRDKKSGEARNLLTDMLNTRYIPNSALCCKVIDVLCEEGKADEAYELWKRLLDSNCRPDNRATSTLIHWLCKEGKVMEAKKLFDQFEKGSTSIPSLLTYNTLIAGMCERGELCEAGKLWDDMVEKGLVPNAFTYNMLIKGFCDVGNVNEGLRVMEEMIEKGCLPNKSTYSILMEGFRVPGEEAVLSRFLSLAVSAEGVEGECWNFLLPRLVSSLDDGKNILDRILLSASS